MDIGMFMPTHGLLTRDGADMFLSVVPGPEIRPVEVAQVAERVGFHSLWFGDHVTIALETTSGHVANPESRKRAYPPRPHMMDGAVVMGAIATATSRIRLGPCVLIAPYRGPLNDARQFATVDVLSNGRLIMGVGAGWMKEEFDALDLPYEERGPMTDECIQIYKRSWSDDVVSFHGKFYDFDNLSMDPKPVQKPHPPIIFGSIAMVGARRAARLCDGFFPMFGDTYPDPYRFGYLQDEIRREAETIGRDLSNFSMTAIASARITDADDPLAKKEPRPICTGAKEQILDDLARFADAGYGSVVLNIACPSARVDELIEQMEWIGRDVIPAARDITATGEWKPEI